MKKPSNRATLNIVVTAFLIAAALLAAAYTHASSDPCQDAIKQGYYTEAMMDQCRKDYSEAK